MTQMILFSDRACPFAHRVLSLVHHLGLALELREARIGDKPAGIERYSASGSIPLLVDGDLVLTESRVMLEHIADRCGLSAPVPGDLSTRTRTRHAMTMIDQYVVPAMQGRWPLDGPRLLDVMRTLETATAVTEPAPSVWVFHIAPIWLHLAEFRRDLAVTQAILARPQLRAWLEAAGQLPSVRAGWPSQATLSEVYDEARAAGLIPPQATRSAS